MSDAYWKKHEKDCPYAEGNRCFLVAEPGPESCKGCRWYDEEKENDKRRSKRLYQRMVSV